MTTVKSHSSITVYNITAHFTDSTSKTTFSVCAGRQFYDQLIVHSAVSLCPLTDQPLEDRLVHLAESSWGIELHRLPSMHDQYPVTVHDGVDPVDINTKKGSKET